MKKYDSQFIQRVVDTYTTNHVISQAELAEKFKVPLGTVVGWLRCKQRGLTPFQRYKRNRDNLIRKRWQAVNNQLKNARTKRDSIAPTYGLTKARIYQLVSSKSEE